MLQLTNWQTDCQRCLRVKDHAEAYNRLNRRIRMASLGAILAGMAGFICIWVDTVTYGRLFAFGLVGAAFLLSAFGLFLYTLLVYQTRLAALKERLDVVAMACTTDGVLHLHDERELGTPEQYAKLLTLEDGAAQMPWMLQFRLSEPSDVMLSFRHGPLKRFTDYLWELEVGKDLERLSFIDRYRSRMDWVPRLDVPHLRKEQGRHLSVLIEDAVRHRNVAEVLAARHQATRQIAIMIAAFARATQNVCPDDLEALVRLCRADLVGVGWHGLAVEAEVEAEFFLAELRQRLGRMHLTRQEVAS